jgi:hypothetical protein
MKTYEANRPFPTDVTSPAPTQLCGPQVNKDVSEKQLPPPPTDGQKKGSSK